MGFRLNAAQIVTPRTLLMVVLAAAVAKLTSIDAPAQSAVPTITVQAAAQSKVYGAPDPQFTYNYQGFKNGDSASVLSGQPVVTAPQRVQNLWQFTESLPASVYSL